MARPANALSASSAHRVGARTLTVTNTFGDTITREADDTVFIHAGPEISVAATKTFCSQVATMALVAIHIGRQRDAISSSEVRGLLKDVRGLPGAVQQALDAEADVREAAEAYADGDAFFFVSRRLGAPMAR
nr:hypothetical protein [Halorubrum tropicale]